MNKLIIFLSGLLIALQCSCSAINTTHADHPGLELCGGFDHSKRFPSKENRPFGVNYDRSMKMLTGQEGVWYFSNNGKNKILRQYYQDDLEMSSKEKKYQKCFEEKEKKFDHEFAGEIKAKLLAASDTFVGANGKTIVIYPIYLEGTRLPKGLVTPCSYFKSSFLGQYVKARDREGDLRKYILSTELIKDATMREVDGFISTDLVSQFRTRYNSVFGEYVLSYYHLKGYKDQLERKKVFEQLANYYAELAYKSAGEALYAYRKYLTLNQQIKISAYFASRVFSFVLQCSDKEFISKLKVEYHEKIVDICRHNLIEGKYKKKFDTLWRNRKNDKEYLEISDKLEQSIRVGEERCIND